MPTSRIQILSGGHWPSSAGLIHIDETIMSDVVSSYRPSRYRAPLTVTHRLPPGQSERTLPYAADLAQPTTHTGTAATELSETHPAGQVTLNPNGLAYGTPTRLERRPDGGVDAVFDRISPCFVQWAKQGNLLSVSPGLYRPDDIGNPTPGKWALKHIAGLGSEPSAQKGMQPLLSGLALAGGGVGLSEFSKKNPYGTKAAGVSESSHNKNSLGLCVYHSSFASPGGELPTLASAIAQRRLAQLWT